MTTYRSNVDPADRVAADSPHADVLHNAPDRDRWFGYAPVGAPGEPPPPPFNAPYVGPSPNALAMNLDDTPEPWVARNLDAPRAGDFNVEATLIAAAVRCCTPQVDDGHEPLCPVYGYPPPVKRDADRDTPTGAEPVAPPVTPALPDLDGVSWAQVMAWAREADRRVYSDIDGSLQCYEYHANTGHDQGEFYWSDAMDRAKAVQSLIAFLGHHWACVEPGR